MQRYYMTKDELYHHGIKGQKWGVRNYQNEDGSYTEAGKERYGIGQKIKNKLSDPKIKKAIKIGAAIAGTALLAYGSYKVYDVASKHADTILKGRLYAQKAKMDSALTKYDYRSSIATKLASGDKATFDRAVKDSNQALSEYNQHKNIYEALDSNYRNSSKSKRIKDAYNLVKYNKAHGTSAKETYKYLKEQIPKGVETIKKAKPLSEAGKKYYYDLLG